MICYGFVEMIFWTDVFAIRHNKDNEESGY